jgi:hypothetical protein
MARTRKVWSPSASPARLSGLVHAPQAPPSSRHSNEEPASSEENSKVGAALELGSLGATSMVVSGAAESTVQAKLAGVASRLPAASLARTAKVWPPSARPA